MAVAPVPADPRPSVVDSLVIGSTCSACGHSSTRTSPRCERCLAATTPASFGPGGTVWSATTVHIPVGERTPPFVLAYVDLDAGPRVLAHVHGAEPPMGATVEVVGVADGDVVVEVRS